MTNVTPMYGYDPRGSVEAEKRSLAPRITSLSGLRVGVLDNAKMKARKLLDGATAILDAEYGFARRNYYLKEGFSYSASPEMIAEMAADNDVVITAIGD
jgi:hypothetical protein